MNDLDSAFQRRPVPRCMRITELPIELPSTALTMLVAQLLGQNGSGTTVGESELKTFALHTWRLGRRVDGMPDSEGRLKRQLQDSHSRLSDALNGLGVTIEDPAHKAFIDGWLEVEVIAWEDPDGPAPEGVKGPWIKQTMRPIIRRGAYLLCKGEVVIADPDSPRRPGQPDEENQQ